MIAKSDNFDGKLPSIDFLKPLSTQQQERILDISNF
jgi:hypothetical protein